MGEPGVITAKDGIEAMATYVLHQNEIRVILLTLSPLTAFAV